MRYFQIWNSAIRTLNHPCMQCSPSVLYSQPPQQGITAPHYLGVPTCTSDASAANPRLCWLMLFLKLQSLGQKQWKKTGASVWCTGLGLMACLLHRAQGASAHQRGQAGPQEPEAQGCEFQGILVEYTGWDGRPTPRESAVGHLGLKAGWRLTQGLQQPSPE